MRVLLWALCAPAAALAQPLPSLEPVALELGPAPRRAVAAVPVVRGSRSPFVPIAGNAAWPRQSTPVPTAPRLPSRPVRPWTISVVTGLPSQSPLHDMERAMRDAAFDDDRGFCFFDFCLPGVSHPFSTTGRAYRDSWTASVNRRVRPRLGVSVAAGRTLIGWTTGQHRTTFTFLEIETTMSHVAPLVTFTPAAGLRLGIGPGIFTTAFARTGLDRQALTTTRRPGLLAEASLTFPRRSRVFAELSLQERLVGRQPLGPIDSFDALTGGTATFPRTQVRVAHWFIGLGAGVRF
jgi:hypothetical protein